MRHHAKSILRTGPVAALVVLVAGLPLVPTTRAASADVGARPVIQWATAYWKQVTELGDPPVYKLHVVASAVDADSRVGNFAMLALRPDGAFEGGGGVSRWDEAFTTQLDWTFSDGETREELEQEQERLLALTGILVRYSDESYTPSVPTIVPVPPLPDAGAPKLTKGSIDLSGGNLVIHGSHLKKSPALEIDGAVVVDATILTNKRGTTASVDVTGGLRRDGAENRLGIVNSRGRSNVALVRVGTASVDPTGAPPSILSAHASIEPDPTSGVDHVFRYDATAVDPDSRYGALRVLVLDRNGQVSYDFSDPFLEDGVFQSDYAILAESHGRFDPENAAKMQFTVYDFDGNMSAVFEVDVEHLADARGDSAGAVPASAGRAVGPVYRVVSGGVVTNGYGLPARLVAAPR